MQNENTISIVGKIYCQLRYFRFRCRSRSHKRSKINSKCGPTFSPLCTWRTAGGYIDKTCRCPINLSLISGIICATSKTAWNVDNPEFGIFYDLMTTFMILPVYCITRKNFSTC